VPGVRDPTQKLLDEGQPANRGETVVTLKLRVRHKAAGQKGQIAVIGQTVAERNDIPVKQRRLRENRRRCSHQCQNRCANPKDLVPKFHYALPRNFSEDKTLT